MQSLTDAIRHSLTQLGVWSASPFAFAIVGIYGVLWYIFQPATVDWHAVATLVVWLMTLVIQRAEHRDTQAIHAKLDELLSADPRARTNLSQIDKREPEEIESTRAKGPK